MVIEPDDLKTIGQVIARAREVMDPGVFLWAAAGVGEEVTVSRNTMALRTLALVPSVGRDVSAIDTSTTFLGVPLSLPVMLAPVGALALYDSSDALGAARVATAMGTLLICSIHTTSKWEEVAATSPGRHLFQIYSAGDRGWFSDIVSRLEDAQFGGLVMTLDSPLIGRRDRSIESSFQWSPQATENVNLSMAGWDESWRSRFTWRDLEWLCHQTDLPVVAKGIMTPEDAAKAAECGVSGIIVSNHGGRMVDHSVSTIEVLTDILEVAPQRLDVAVDSGFNNGADISKALALGAKAVGIGRLQCWGLAAGGPAGLTRVLEILRDEITVTMANTGHRNLGEMDPSAVRWSIPVPPSQIG